MELTLASFLGDLTLTRVAQVAIGAWSLLLAFRLRRRGPEWPYVCALACGMLATPYVHLDDLAMLGLAAWLCLRARTPSWTWVYVLAGALAVEGEPIWGPAPVIAAEVGALALLSVAAFKHDDRDREHDEPERESDARLGGDGEHAAEEREGVPVRGA